MTSDKFTLSAELKAHEMDVRAVCAGRNSLFSASRDKTVIWWARTPNGPPGTQKFEQKATFRGHTHFISSLAYLLPTPDRPHGLVISGSMDKLILVWDPLEPLEPVFTLIGHSDAVCTLNVIQESNILVSGSWDKTARVWLNWETVTVLEGHQQAVWGVLGWSPEMIVTASADKTIKIWVNGKCTKTLTGHTDVVRALARVNSAHFISSSNDGTVRVWNIDGSCIHTLNGHQSFVYSVDCLPVSEFVSSGEDRSVRVWKDGLCTDTLLQPARSMWTVCVLDNGDIAAGGNDGVIRVFTRHKELVASEAELRAFEEAVAGFTLNEKEVGNINKEKLPGLEALTKPGKKDQDVVMVKNGNLVEAHQWSTASGQWIKLGEVVDAVGNGRKQLFEGREYDYVFDVDVQEGVPPLKLPYNANQNPYEAAQIFIQRNELPQSYLDQVSQFIIRNTQGAAVVGAAPSTFNNPDPYTGSSTSSSADKVLPLPKGAYLKFSPANLPVIKKKFEELQKSGQIPNEPVDALFEHLKTKSGRFDCSVVEKLLGGDPSGRFPVFDLLRLLVLTSTHNFPQVETLISKSEISSNPNGPSAFLFVRTLCNAFASAEVKTQLLEKRKLIVATATALKEITNKNLALAVSTLFLNYSIVLCHELQDEELATEILFFLTEHLSESKEEETTYRELVTIGNISYKYSDLKQVLKLEDVVRKLRQLSGKGGRITAIVQELAA